MNDATPEQLSALMDGELPRDELRFLLRRLDGDAALKHRWGRYQVASSVLRREFVAPVAGDAFAAAILSRLDGRQAAGYFGQALRWAGGGAIAAAVAVAALVMTKPAVEQGAPAAAIGSLMAAASVPAPAVTPVTPVTARQARQSVLAEQGMASGFPDYAQPASYESVVPLYGTNRNGSGQSADAPNGFVPYVLLIGSRQPSQQQQAEQAPAAQETPVRQ